MKACILLSLSIVLMVSCSTKEKKLTPAQKTALHYLYNSSLISDTFSRILWDDPIDMRGINSEERMMYFLFPRTLNRATTMQKVALDTSLIEFAPCETGMCDFGGMHGKIDGYFAFKMPLTNLKVDSNKKFQCNLLNEKFICSYKELMQNLDSTTCYSGPEFLDISGYILNAETACNIGIYISKKNRNPLVKKLASHLIEGLQSNEEKAQRLLDFVTNEIQYSYEDHWYNAEVTKLSHEVLLSGEADCSGKSTLLASLLEQCDIPYCLLYFDRHINVGVKGNFKDENHYVFKLKKETYYMAETTVPKFKIGESRLSNSEILEKVIFYQIPYRSKNVIEAKTNSAIPFVPISTEYDEEVNY